MGLFGGQRQTVTLKERFEYLNNIFKGTSGINISYPEFMECLFSKLENDIRMGNSGIEKYYENGEGKTKPLTDGKTDFEYDYKR